MNLTFLLLAALKASVLAAGGIGAAQILPPAWLHARRLVTVLTLWLLLFVPWITMPLQIAAPVVPMPAASPSVSYLGWVLLSLWLLGAVVRGLRLLLEWRDLRHLLSQSQLHSRHGNIEIRIVPGLSSPCLFGALRVRVLMPVAALDWPARQWTAALSHELQHAQQADGLHRIICALIRALFWWNPLIHFLCHRLEIESELCCDQAAAASPTLTKRAYGEMLLGLASDTSWRMASGWSSRKALQERIERLLQPATCSGGNASLRVLAMLAVLAAALVAACGIRTRTAAQNPVQTEATLRLTADPFPAD